MARFYLALSPADTQLRPSRLSFQPRTTGAPGPRLSSQCRAHRDPTKRGDRMKSFENKVAAITGAGSGIGRALAYALARQGCHLALADVNSEALAETASSARKLGVTVTENQVNVAEREAVHA